MKCSVGWSDQLARAVEWVGMGCLIECLEGRMGNGLGERIAEGENAA